jgi:hypothetical protein
VASDSNILHTYLGAGAVHPITSVDNSTYLAQQKHTFPLHWLGVIKVWNGSITDPVSYLHSCGSDGLVDSCANLPSDLRGAASRSGEICALSRAWLDRLVATRAAT